MDLSSCPNRSDLLVLPILVAIKKWPPKIDHLFGNHKKVAEGDHLFLYPSHPQQVDHLVGPLASFQPEVNWLRKKKLREDIQVYEAQEKLAAAARWPKRGAVGVGFLVELGPPVCEAHHMEARKERKRVDGQNRRWVGDGVALLELGPPIFEAHRNGPRALHFDTRWERIARLAQRSSCPSHGREALFGKPRLLRIEVLHHQRKRRLVDDSPFDSAGLVDCSTKLFF